MVLPAAALAGRALLSQGARMAGSQGGRAMASSVGGGSSGAIMKMATDMAIMKAMSTKSNGTLGKIFKTLEKHSPMLQQQMLILRKGISLPLRAIGDVISRFVRPWARFSMRLGIEIYKLIGKFFGGGATSKFSTESVNDRLKQLGTELISANAEDNTVLADLIQAQIDALNALSTGPNAKTIDPESISAGIFDDLITVLAALNTDGIIGAIDAMKDGVRDDLSDLSDSLGEVWDDFKGFVEPALDWAQKIWDEHIFPMWEGVVSWATQIYAQFIDPWFTPMKDWATKIWDEFFAESWKEAELWADKIWAILKEAFIALRDYIIDFFKKDDDKTFLEGTLPGQAYDIGVRLGEFTKKVEDIIRTPPKITGTSATGGVSSKTSSGDLLDQYWDIQGGRNNFQDTMVNMADDLSYEIFKTMDQNMQDRYANAIPKATGGEISESGVYGLHAGERVITAGENSRSGGNTMNFSSRIIINNPKINSQMDIKALARQLAKLQERELRRRVSYV